MSTLDDQSAEDAVAICKEIGETVFLRNALANPRGIYAVVERDTGLMEEDGEVTEVLTVYVPRKWPDGAPTIVEGGDQIEVALRPGESRRLCTVGRVRAVDAGMWELEVQP